MKCDKCGYSDNGSGDWAHACGPVAIQQTRVASERILELADKATSIVESPPNREGWTSSYAYFDKEKFAELIVKECALQCNHNDDMDRILEYFGVDSTSIKVGSRVKVVSGFNVGAKGTVSYIEPTGRMWVMRDGASTDVFYTPDEVVRIEQ